MKSKKERILDISFSLFLEKGYDKTSISDILRESDIARGTLYYHFASKEAIMDAIIERSAKKIVEEAKSIVWQKELSVYEKIFSLFAGANMKRMSGGDLMIDYLNQPQNALLHEKSNRSFIQKITPLLGDIIREGVEEGIFDNAFPCESAEIILVTIMGFLDAHYEYLKEKDFERRAESLLYNIERMLGAKEGSFAAFRELSLQGKRGGSDERRL